VGLGGGEVAMQNQSRIGMDKERSDVSDYNGINLGVQDSIYWGKDKPRSQERKRFADTGE